MKNIKFVLQKITKLVTACRETRLKIYWLDVDGGIADEEQEHGGEVGGQNLRLDLPLQGDDHVHLVLLLQNPDICDGEHGEIFVNWQEIHEFLCLFVFVHHQHLIF